MALPKTFKGWKKVRGYDSWFTDPTKNNSATIMLYPSETGKTHRVYSRRRRNGKGLPSVTKWFKTKTKAQDYVDDLKKKYPDG